MKVTNDFSKYCLLILATGIMGCRQSPPLQVGLKQEAYLWNRNWEERGFKPLSDVPAAVQGMVILSAEVRWRLSRFEVVKIPTDFEELKHCGRPLGLAIRMGNYPGPFHADDEAGRLLVDLATGLVKEAEEKQCPLQELQIDFDCAESKIEGYQVWVEAIRKAVKPIPFTFTALPSWLKRSEFRGLARASDGFVLQVHSVEPPDKMNGPVRLCDPIQARGWVEIAGRLAVPFRVALPTYSCWLIFNKEGRLAKVDTSPRRPWSRDGGIIRRVEADPVAMADLVREWNQRHPDMMRGIIWYRLPSRSENRGWAWPTFLSVLDGRHPVASPLELEFKTRERNVYDLSLINKGEIKHAFPKEIVLTWKAGTWVGSDTMGEYYATHEKPSEVRLQRVEGGEGQDVEPGGSRNLGWIRLENAKDLKGVIHGEK